MTSKYEEFAPDPKHPVCPEHGFRTMLRRDVNVRIQEWRCTFNGCTYKSYVEK